jgi:thioredoxin 1
MIYGIRIMAIILFVAMVGFGCSGESKNKPADLKTSVQDSAKVVSVENVKQDRPLVTFVELGSVKCIPCKMMQPIMDEIEKEYAGQVKVVFHDVWTEEGRPYAEQYGIRAIPTQVFLDSEGKEYFRHTGFFPKEELVKVLKQKGVE